MSLSSGGSCLRVPLALTADAHSNDVKGSWVHSQVVWRVGVQAPPPISWLMGGGCLILLSFSFLYG